VNLPHTFEVIHEFADSTQRPGVQRPVPFGEGIHTSRRTLPPTPRLPCLAALRNASRGNQVARSGPTPAPPAAPRADRASLGRSPSSQCRSLRCSARSRGYGLAASWSDYLGGDVSQFTAGKLRVGGGLETLLHAPSSWIAAGQSFATPLDVKWPAYQTSPGDIVTTL
jgi:hypothetical protein